MGLKGHIVGDLGFAATSWSGQDWWEVTLSLGSPAAHTGFSLGRCDGADSERRTTLLAVGKLLGASLDSQAAFDAEVNSAATLTVGPFPGVVPATWYATLTASQKADLRTRVANKARSVLA